MKASNNFGNMKFLTSPHSNFNSIGLKKIRENLLVKVTKPSAIPKFDLVTVKNSPYLYQGFK